MLGSMDGWEKFGARIKSEMEQAVPPWTFDRIYKRTKESGSGVSPETVKKLISGDRKPTRMDRVFALCDLFGWTHESVEKMRRGEEPDRASVASMPSDVIAEMDSLATAIEDSAAAIRRMLAQVERSQS